MENLIQMNTHISPISGQALTEYGLTGLIILVILIPALTLLDNNLNISLQGLIQGLTFRTPIAAVKQNMTQPSPSSLVATTATTPSIVPPQATIQSIQTLGVNGTTALASDHIKILAQQLKDNDTVSEEQYNSLIQLANEGHRLATAEDLLEEALQNKQSRLSFEGKSYTVQEFLTVFGFQSGSYHDLNQLSASDVKPLLVPFAQMYQQLDQANLLNTEEGYKIRTLATEILALGDSLSWASCQALGIVSNNQGQAAAVSTVDMSTLSQQIIKDYSYYSGQLPEIANIPSVAEQTNGNSSQICATGSGTDSGQHCSP